MSTKLVILMRTDLKEMTTGKMLVQAGHAVQFALEKLQQRNDCETIKGDWAIDDRFKKVVLRIDSEAALYKISEKANALGLNNVIVVDHGLTCFDGVHTPTCLAIGPASSDVIDSITKRLRLF